MPLCPIIRTGMGWAYLNPNIDRSDCDQPAAWGRYASLAAGRNKASFKGQVLAEAELGSGADIDG